MAFSKKEEMKQHSFWPTWEGNRLFSLLLAIFLAYGIVWLGSLIWLNTLKVERIGKADEPQHTITIEGVGKVTGTPTIAAATLGLQTTASQVAVAQKENSEKMNAFINALKALEIPADDIQTAEYSVYPQFRYDPDTGKSEIDGYTVSQSVSVKIRDLSKISATLGLAGEQGLNQVSGVNFTIDDPEVLQAQARQEALKQAADKAGDIAEALGVRLVSVVGFYETTGMPSPGPYPYADLARGGAPAPTVEAGTLDVVVNVQVTFAIE
ncbi:MAG: SIMPL domain-containing protein [bacterium]|nr:SIMPL domain-containing protein [bacterium]